MRSPNSSSGISKILAIVVVIVILVVAALIGTYFFTQPINISFGLASSTSIGVSGQPIIFTIIVKGSATPSSINWNFGDGQTTTTTGLTTSHVYASGGNYLVSADVMASGGNFLHPISASVSNDQSLLPIQVQSNLSEAKAQYSSVPAINLVGQNQRIQVVSVGQSVPLAGGYLEQPSNSNWTIRTYAWSFGNGSSEAIAANASNDFLPSRNVSTTFSQPGLYPVSLTITTNDSAGQTSNVTTVETLAAQSTSSPFAILTSGQKLLNPNIITSVEVAPGGPYSWDPQVDYDNVGEEEISNIFQRLLVYNGSSLNSFIPDAATQLPTMQNGEISSDLRNYTFQVRSDQFFSNGDQLKAYDVWYSFMRAIAFTSGTPGTPDWVIAQYLIPGVQNGTASAYSNNTWTAAYNSLSYNNVSNTITFHFNRPMSPLLVYQLMAGGASLDGSIIDASYAVSVGAGFSESTWTSYINQANAPNYNQKMQWSPIASGPYMIQSYTPGQSVEMTPNPHYGGVPGIPKVNDTVVIDWVKEPEVAILMLQDGQADSVEGLPTSDFSTIQNLQSQGQVKIYNFPVFNEYTYAFNLNISKTLEAQQFGSFTEPSNYFADPATRLAFINSFDYLGYLNNLVGNAKYNSSFASRLKSFIYPGVFGYPANDSQLPFPNQNLAAARGNFSTSAWHDMQIHIPIVVVSGYDPDTASAEEWASILNQISGGNITASVVQIEPSQLFSDFVPGANPLGCYFIFYAGVDYPDASDLVGTDILQGGIVASSNAWSVSGFSSLTPSSSAHNGSVYVNGTPYPQSTVFNWMNGNFTQGAIVTDSNTRLHDYLTAQQLEVDLGLYVYVADNYQFLYWSPHLSGVQFEENPGAGGQGIIWYFFMNKS